MLQDIMQQLKKAPGLVSKLLITTIKPHTREDELIWSVWFWPTILWFSCEATRIFVYDGIFSFHSLQNMFKNHEAVVYLEFLSKLISQSKCQCWSCVEWFESGLYLLTFYRCQFSRFALLFRLSVLRTGLEFGQNNIKSYPPLWLQK